MAGVLEAAESVAAGVLQSLAAVFALGPPEHGARIEIPHVGHALHHSDDIDRYLAPARRAGQRPRRAAHQGMGERRWHVVIVAPRVVGRWHPLDIGRAKRGIHGHGRPTEASATKNFWHMKTFLGDGACECAGSG